MKSPIEKHYFWVLLRFVLVIIGCVIPWLIYQFIFLEQLNMDNVLWFIIFLFVFQFFWIRFTQYLVNKIQAYFKSL